MADDEPVAGSLDRPTKVFISYSRADSDFAGRLREALAAANFTAYLDLTDIHPGEPWQERLGGLIAGSDVVAFIISPASLGSPICDWEVNEAERLGKRIVPVVWVDPADDTVPQRLKRLNYIFLRAQDEWATGFAKLVRAIDTDIVWLREHTRLGEIAARWQALGAATDSDVLLRGRDLSDALSWISRPAPAGSQVTPPLADFLGASRADEDRRLREQQTQIARTRRLQKRVGYAFAALFLLLLAGAGATVWQMRATSVRESAMFLSRAEQAYAADRCDLAMRYAVAGLPAQGALPLGYDTGPVERALLKYAGACRLHAAVGWPAQIAGFRFTTAGPLLITKAPDGSRVIDLSTGATKVMLRDGGKARWFLIAPDGATAVSISDSHEAGMRLWDLGTGAERAVLGRRESADAVVAYSNDGALFAGGLTYEEVSVWETESGRKVATLPARNQRLSFSAGGALLFVSSQERAALWEWRSRKVRREFRPEADTSFAYAAASPSGNFVLLVPQGSGGDRAARVWDTRNGRAVATIGPASSAEITLAAFSGDDTVLATRSRSENNPRLWDIPSGRLRAILEGHALEVRWLGFNARNDTLATASQDRTARLWNVRTGMPIAVLPGHQNEIRFAEFSPDGDRLLSAGEDVRLWDARPRGPGAMTRMSGSSIHDSEFSPDGNRVVSVGGGIRIWNALTGEVVKEFPDPPRAVATDARFVRDGQLLLTRDTNHLFRLIDATTGALIASRQVLPEQSRVLESRLVFSPDRSMVAIAHDNGQVQVLSTDDLAVVWALEHETLGGRALGFDLTGNHLWIVDQARLQKIPLPRPARLGPTVAPGNGRGSPFLITRRYGGVGVYDGESGAVRTVRFLPDNDLTQGTVQDPNGERAFTWASGQAWIWEPRSGRVLHKLDLRLVSAAAFSPNGRWIATGGDRHLVRLWDVESGVELAAFSGHTWGVRGLQFSPDGRHLLSWSMDTTVRVWRFDPVGVERRGSIFDHICGLRIAGAQAFTSEEMSDPILQGRSDLQNPCENHGVLSTRYYAMQAERFAAWARSIPRQFIGKGAMP